MSEDKIQPDPDRPRRNVRRDDGDERPRRQRSRDDYDEDDDITDRIRSKGDATGGLIPYKNPQALTSYYCGVFSLIPCLGLILGPIAIILGILGLGYVKKHPTASGTAHAIVGIVLGSLVTLGHLGVVAMIALREMLK